MWGLRNWSGSDSPAPADGFPEFPVYQSFEEMHVLLREGGFESRIFAQSGL